MMVILKAIYNLLVYAFLKPVDIVTSIIVEVKSICLECMLNEEHPERRTMNGND